MMQGRVTSKENPGGVESIGKDDSTATEPYGCYSARKTGYGNVVALFQGPKAAINLPRNIET